MSDSLALAEAVQNRDALLKAVAYSAKSLLSSGDWRAHMNAILMQLGLATRSSRVYVFEHSQAENGSLLTSLAFEWCADGISPQITNPDLQQMPVGYVGFQRWIDQMQTGGTLFGAVDSFPEDERPLLEQQEIKSLVVLPFFVDGAWWGFIGLDQCDRVRIWSDPEIEALQALGSMIGSAIERSLAEQKLQHQFIELQKANRELDLLVYSMSHDLRAPLASLQGLINVAQLDSSSEQFKQYLTMMRTSVLKLDGFIHEVLDYSANARIELLREEVDFATMIQEVADQVTQHDSLIHPKWKITIDGVTPFFSDRRRLRIVFNNLFSNAVKFIDTTKAQPQISVHINRTPDGVRIVVEDNGIGIDAKHLDKIFNMFYRATNQNPGSGLGLYITREVLNKLNGTIQVDSVLGEFTRFKVWLPEQTGS